MGGALDHAVEPCHEQQQKRRHAYGDEREVKFQPEHEAEHADDGQQIGEDVERRRRRKALDGLDVVGDGRQQRAGLVAVVVAERKMLQMVIDSHAQIVRHPLADTFRVIVVDIAGDRP